MEIVPDRTPTIEKTEREMKKEQVIKIISLIIVLIILTFFTIKLFPLFKGLSTENGRLIFKDRIQNFGIQGVFSIIGLMFAQVFLAILPGEPVEMLAGMCYGPIGGMLVLYAGVFISTIFIFLCVKKLGRRFIYSFVSKERIEKIEKSRLLSNPKTIYSILFILFFIPGTPKDILTYIAAVLPINSKKFLLIATFARTPSIVTSTIAGANLIEGNWSIIGIIYGISFLISGMIIYYINQKGQKIEMENL